MPLSRPCTVLVWSPQQVTSSSSPLGRRNPLNRANCVPACERFAKGFTFKWAADVLVERVRLSNVDVIKFKFFNPT